MLGILDSIGVLYVVKYLYEAINIKYLEFKVCNRGELFIPRSEIFETEFSTTIFMHPFRSGLPISEICGTQITVINKIISNNSAYLKMKKKIAFSSQRRVIESRWNSLA